MDLIPLEPRVENVGADHSNMASERRKDAIGTRADAKIADGPVGPLTRHAARLVPRDDLDVDSALVTVLRVEHRSVTRVGRGVEGDITVARIQLRRSDDLPHE